MPEVSVERAQRQSWEKPGDCLSEADLALGCGILLADLWLSKKEHFGDLSWLPVGECSSCSPEHLVLARLVGCWRGVGAGERKAGGQTEVWYLPCALPPPLETHSSEITAARCLPGLRGSIKGSRNYLQLYSFPSSFSSQLLTNAEQFQGST